MVSITDNDLQLIQQMMMENEVSSKHLMDEEMALNMAMANETEDILEESYLKAYTEIPEFFIPKQSPIIKAKINGKEIDILIDTGASISVISKEMASQYGLDHLIDMRHSGELKGIGTQKIHGKIYYTEVELSIGMIPVSLTVNSNSDMPMLILGMDFIRGYGVIMDFQKNQMIINGQSIAI